MDLKEAQAGTILGLVNEIFEKGDFPEPESLEEPCESWADLGELTDYEKAVVLARNRVHHRHDKLVEEVNSGQEEKNSTNSYLVDRLWKKYEMLHNMFWVSLQERLGEKEKEYNCLAVCVGWKVYGYNKQAAFFSAIFAEECADCPVYDDCGLPIKQPH